MLQEIKTTPPMVKYANLDLRRVPWIAEDYSLGVPTLAEKLRARYTGLPVETSRRLKFAHNLHAGTSLNDQVATFRFTNGGYAYYNAGEFFATMPVDTFMTGPKTEDWALWCDERMNELDNQYRMVHQLHMEGVDEPFSG